MAKKDEEESNEKTAEVLEIRGDRVVYGASRKVSDGNYGSYDFHCSLSREVRPGDTVGATVKQSIGFVEKVLSTKIKQTTGKKMGY